jgi:hypothetical protein
VFILYLTGTMEKEVLARITAQIKNKNIRDALEDLRAMHRCFVALIGVLENHQVTLPHQWYEYHQAIAIKFRLNIYSIIELYEIRDNLPKGVIYHDLSSIYLLNRSLLETYLTFFYCYILPKSDEEGLTNYYIFKISGLVQRQGYGIDSPHELSPDSIKQREDEKLKIKEYQLKLENLPFFVNLPFKPAERRKLIEGKYAKRFGFVELIKLSELKDLLFADMWKLYSNYAHCELLGLLQINSYGEDPDSIDNALYGTLTNTLMVVSAMIADFVGVFKDTSVEKIDIPELDEVMMTLLLFWYGMGTNKVKF